MITIPHVLRTFLFGSRDYWNFGHKSGQSDAAIRSQLGSILFLDSNYLYITRNNGSTSNYQILCGFELGRDYAFIVPYSVLSSLQLTEIIINIKPSWWTAKHLMTHGNPTTTPPIYILIY